jgi:dihydroxy-acid dehydratase
LVRDGDKIRLSVASRQIELLVDDAELERRRSQQKIPSRPVTRGYQRIYDDNILQADEGCDFSFLRALPG